MKELYQLILHLQVDAARKAFRYIRKKLSYGEYRRIEKEEP
jgi:hypothetical protein